MDVHREPSWVHSLWGVRPQCSSSSLAQGECLFLVSVSLAHCALRPSGYSWGQNGRKHTHTQKHTHLYKHSHFSELNIPQLCPRCTHIQPINVRARGACGRIAADCHFSTTSYLIRDSFHKISELSLDICTTTGYTLALRSAPVSSQRKMEV